MATKTKKEEAVKAEETVKAPAAKTAEKPKAAKTTKTAAKAKAAPKTVKKTAAKTTKAAAPAVKVFVEYQGKQLDLDAVLEAVKVAAGKGVKTLEVYVKPEDGAAYYVADGKTDGKADL